MKNFFELVAKLFENSKFPYIIYFTPIGSYAMGCLRKNHLEFDAIASFDINI